MCQQPILSAYGIEVSQHEAVSKNSKETASKKLYCRILYLNSCFQLLHIPKINLSSPPKRSHKNDTRCSQKKNQPPRL